MFNLSDELKQNLRVYEKYYNSRSAAQVPRKVDAPMVQDLYMDASRPVGGREADEPLETADGGWDEGWEDAPSVTYRPQLPGDPDYLAQINDRLKTQARRYPHPITNEMEVLA